MFQWSWFTAGFTDPGRVEDSLKRKGVLKQIKQGDIPFCLQACKICPHCQIPVPARSYHCSMCETCVLRQDHHCGVIGSCVGDRNFKPFILSFFYSGIFGIFVGISGTWSIVATGINVITLIVSIYGFILGCILIGFGSSFAYQSFETFSHTHQKASITWKRGVHLLLETFGPTWKERLLPNYLYETEFAWPDIEWTVGTPLL
ncbi:DHHC zinc finger domain containing protein [Trichomonas vaginalis G3]|uniref:Palmitoyltransferase n=1 Tax=Trichomonas vaginalis (strain ATCC PRA-98 / G3) TaxID=412133 RepID=A2EQV6_TRIV3|nr:cysteine S-palmitoyltransferase protein [Trichomonas vaginalis G3]EAY04930.1 DHHC zinc finger domain containing protein [Trichomonas vaginalis G3]KAI5508788.1 cysteine S-palmitoyltransferase protein [Trichomonas vaginalis G3]|eukprot:XP_001317153.1 DHHC zinc finger domain containing protein [Trichomonas vaginalis G3]